MTDYLHMMSSLFISDPPGLATRPPSGTTTPRERPPLMGGPTQLTDFLHVRCRIIQQFFVRIMKTLLQ